MTIDPLQTKGHTMPIKVSMPALSPTMTAGNLAKWVKKEGDKIKPGDVIAEIETDKATMEVESVDEGVLAKIVIAQGTQNVPVGTLMAIILEDGEDAKAVDAIVAEAAISQANTHEPSLRGAEGDAAISRDKSTPVVSHEIPDNRNTISGMTNNTSSRIFASPLAKRIAADKGVNLASMQGSGPHGRIIKSDVENMRSGSAKSIGRNAKEFNLEPHSNIRKIIAARLVESKQNVPHFYLNIECMIDNALSIRADINEMATDTKHHKISVNDLIIKASAMALRDVPHANASWSNDGIMLYNNVDVSVAVAIDGGLITPVIRNADQKSTMDLSSEMKILAVRARENKLKPEEFQGGGFTISNLGMYGIRRFSAIINPPQSCILAVGEGVKRAVVEDDQVRIRTIMDVTLSCDHRVVDGAVGAKFLAAFRDYIEKPVKMLV